MIYRKRKRKNHKYKKTTKAPNVGFGNPALSQPFEYYIRVDTYFSFAFFFACFIYAKWLKKSQNLYAKSLLHFPFDNKLRKNQTEMMTQTL